MQELRKQNTMRVTFLLSQFGQIDWQQLENFITDWVLVGIWALIFIVRRAQGTVLQEKMSRFFSHELKHLCVKCHVLVCFKIF